MHITSNVAPINFRFGERIPIGPGRNESDMTRNVRLAELYRYADKKTYPELTIHGRQLLYAKEIECSNINQYKKWEEYAYKNHHK